MSFKVFLITFVMQLLAGALICTVLYLRTPETYLTSEEENTILIFQLTEKLSQVSEEESGEIIDDFIRDTGFDVAIYNEELSTSNEKVFADTSSKLSLKTMEEVEEKRASISDPGDDQIRDVWFNNGEFWVENNNTRYRLEFFCTNTKENIMPRSIKKSMPIMLAVITALSLICSYIYTVLFAKPVKELSEVSQSMAKMDFSRKCNSKRSDEIGDLARDLDVMAENLEEKIQSLSHQAEELKEEVQRREELENQKDVFFAAASHELKTPVTVLEGQIRGMIEGVGAYADHEEYLPRALGTVKRMESLINEILTVSRMQSKSEIVADRIDLALILTEKAKESEELFQVRGIELTKEFEDDLFFIGNKELTSMAVGAFLSNAAFYSTEGVRVEMKAGKKMIGNAPMILTTIRNTDAHIDDEDQAHLFEPFYRTDKSRSRRSGGSGLGLYLAKLIIEKQGGTCSLENDGKDVLATILLPYKEKENA